MDKNNNSIINENIKDDKLLVIDNEGKNIGVITKEKALSLANEAGLDLVLISSSNDPKRPSVAKIVDIGKYLYEMKIKQKSTRSSVQKIKEIAVKPQIAHNDLVTYSKKAIQ
jgi:translation initiation factor IF-3